MRDVAGRSLLTGVVDYLRNRQLLLLLDNFEQVLDAATVVGELQRACPDLVVLVTSRAALRIGGEHEYPVSPLALPDAAQPPTPDRLSQYAAVALFIERAVQIKPDFAVTNANAPAVAEICARLDGLPLAIELAAARTRLLPPEAMLARLGHGLSLLTGGRRDLPARQQTLRGAIAWSYDLLPEAERRVFRRLGAFVGGFTLEAAEAVCNAESPRGSASASETDVPDADQVDVLDAVESLAQHSLLRAPDGAGGEPRFGMLETIREYALDRLAASGEEPAARRRHAEHFLALAERDEPRLVREDVAAWLDRLQADHDNLRAALAWSGEAEDAGDLMPRLAGTLWRFWWMRGYFGEGRAWLERSLDRASRPSVRFKVLFGAANLAFYQTDLERSEELWASALAVARGSDDRPALALALARLGYVVSERGGHDRGLALCRESLEISRQLGGDDGVAASLMSLGHAQYLRGDYDGAVASWEECLRLDRAGGRPIRVPHCLHLVASVVMARGELERAAAMCAEALELFGQRDDRWGLLAARGRLVRIAQLRGEHDRAAVLALEDVALSRDLGSRGQLRARLESLAWVARVRGDAERAARLLGAVERLRELMSRPPTTAQRDEYQAELAVVRASLGEPAFEAAWAAGRAMTLDQAIAYALAEPVDEAVIPRSPRRGISR